LRTRLENVKWPDDPDNQDWGYGVNAGYLKELVSYWLNEFDWRTVEEQINRYRQYRVLVDGVPVHFIYKKAGGANAVPLILTHGWPWSCWDMHKMIDPLTDPAMYGGDSRDALISSSPLCRVMDFLHLHLRKEINVIMGGKEREDQIKTNFLEPQKIDQVAADNFEALRKRTENHRSM
jgi:hypothetical protein